jgi:hypothetical protein
MFVRPKARCVAGLTVLLATFAGCSHQPARVEPPSFNASSAAQQALEKYDKNGDGVISGDELAKSPALKSALSRLDANGDKGVSADEIVERINKWQASRIGLMPFSCTIVLDGRPVEGATVTMEPESFLGDEVKPATAVTDAAGSGRLSIPKDQIADPTMSGIQLGFYRVKISKIVGGKEFIPRKFNEETTLGQEAALDVGEISGRRAVYAVSTK